MKCILVAACFACATAACVADDETVQDEPATDETTQELVGSGRCNAGRWYGSTLLINGWQHNGGSICCDGATIATIHACYTCSPAPYNGPFWCHLY